MSDQNIKKLEFSLDVPLEVTGLVVGKRGATINKIKLSSKANVVLSPDPLPENDKLKRLTIQGSRKEIEIAQDQIVKLLNSWCGFESESGENHKNIDLLPEKTRNIVLAYKSRQPHSRGGPAAVQGHSSQSSAAHSPGQNVAPLHHAQERPKQTQAPSYSAETANNYEARSSAAGGVYYQNADSSAALNGQQQAYRNSAPASVVPTEVLQNFRTELEVPRACISYIVGKQYENIAQLERTSGAQIFPVEPAPGDNPQMIRIVFTGTEQAVRTASVNFWQVVQSKFVGCYFSNRLCRIISKLFYWNRLFSSGPLGFNSAFKHSDSQTTNFWRE